MLLLASNAFAHPVAQGFMEIVIRKDGITIFAKVSAEQVTVAAAFDRNSLPSSDPFTSHGPYLLQHVYLVVDGKTLVGKVVKMTGPEKVPESTILVHNMEYLTYELAFALPEGAEAPREIKLSQDVLNEFSYAPGNPWEASYTIRIGQDGQAPREGLVLTRTSPLTFSADWTAAPAEDKTPIVDYKAMMWDRLKQGIHHILEGYDHLLFVSSLVLAAVTFWDLFKVVSMFTLAHTLTLTLSTLGWVKLPESVVEPMIAASIVIVALQNIFFPKQTRGWTRLLAAFFFGLFHGLGFAGGLLETSEGMHGLAIAAAIIAFSVGVEIGHQAVVVPLYGLLTLARRTKTSEEDRARVSSLALMYGSIVISVAGMFYFLKSIEVI